MWRSVEHKSRHGPTGCKAEVAMGGTKLKLLMDAGVPRCWNRTPYYKRQRWYKRWDEGIERRKPLKIRDIRS
ncbi:jg2394 [Pararge aegeria aegeria]|uniref:Jg2394 protein n=1 Tax=Pararge aegeria aegeria TaxID=348720 RepID=A0A8S4S532_9NEOP|nr:jg2394 [Pararge aegeria aegeria]